MAQEFEGEGETFLTLAIKIDGSNLLTVTNANWSAKDGDQYRLTYYLSSGGYADHLSFGIAADGKNGFGTSFERRFPDYLAGSGKLTIYRGETLVDDLSLTGSGIAVATVRRCVARLKSVADAAARERARLAHIPRDPFASPSPTPDPDGVTATLMRLRPV